MEVYKSGVTARTLCENRESKKKPELEERRFEDTLHLSHVQAPISLLFAYRVEARAETGNPFDRTSVGKDTVAVECNARLSCGNSSSDMDFWAFLVLCPW